MLIEFCLPKSGKAVPSGPDWLHEVKYDGLYEASRVKKFFEINIFSFPAFQEASRRVSAVLR
jgi:bifunctional non-homologous end joining protein LigD